MGKNYVESSLKRFLKRKVKITLGFVVAFMICGSLGFAEDFNFDRNDYPLMNEIDKEKADGYFNAMESLNGLGTDILNGQNSISKDYTSSDGKSTLKIEKEGENYKFSLTNSHFTSAVIDKNLISKETAEFINNTITKTNEYKEFSENFTDKTNDKFMNLTGGSSKGQIGNNITNNGIIAGWTNLQKGTGDNAQVTNNGLLLGKNPQSLESTGALINKGIILATENAQSAGIGNAYNYGAISAIITGQAGKSAYNYGTIEGQTGQSVNGGIGENYGIIISSKTGQNSAGGNSKIYNYGVIDTTEKGMGHTQNSSLYNYGLIKVTDGYGMGNHANSSNGETINRGVIHSSDKSLIFEDGKKKIENTGIVITDNQDVYKKDWAKTGVTLNTKFELQNKNGITIKSDEVDTYSFKDKNIGYVDARDSANSIKLSDITAKRDENGDIVNRKVLGVVADDKNITVFEGKDNLLLDGIDVTGYLINGGTFIDMQNKDLILSDTTITVTEDLTLTKGEKAIAVDLGDTGNLTLMGENEINGIIKGGKNINIVAQQNDTLTTQDGGTLKFENAKNENLEQINFTKVGLDGDAEKIETNFIHTSKGKENTITLNENFVLGNKDDGYNKNTVIEDTSWEENKVIYDIKNLDNIYGNISMGEADNTVSINGDFKKYDGKINLGRGNDSFIVNNNDSQENNLNLDINLGEGNDIFTVKGNTEKDQEGEEIVNVFNYKVTDAETIELQGGTWGNWNDAKGEINFSNNNSKDINSPNFVLGTDTTMKITFNGNESDFENYISKVEGDLGIKHAVIKGTDDTSKVKYIIGKDGIDFDKLSSEKYSFDSKIDYNNSAIFDVKNDEKQNVTVTVKTSEFLGLTGQDRIIYDAYLGQIQSDVKNQNAIDKINKYDSTDKFIEEVIRGTQINGKAYYTAGSVVTMDIADTYLSAVEDFTKRAKKGEWLAQGKYINSDTEFDGGSEVKGYDGDVTGTMGMIEYGFSENTSYGAAYGQGDSEMDIQGGGKLDGDNTYFGAFMKHRTQNGIELAANIGYVENDMDSVLKNEFDVDNIGGNTFEKGTADSSAVILSLKGRKDYKITDTIKLQPVLGARATIINQEKAENPEMDFTIAEQDIIVLEGTAGMGVAKEFAMNSGKLELNTGVEYTFATTSTNNDAEYTLFENEGKPVDLPLEDVDTAENTGTFYAGFDYEHESGVGFNGKYEMMWSDKGDDSRITAGVSYRF